MLKIIIESMELYDEVNDTFVVTPSLNLTLEHSLYSISKWESRWVKPFLGTKEKTDAELLDYILCMDVSERLTMSTLQNMSRDDLNRIFTYINSGMTATTFSDANDKTNNREIITSELIYYWMISCQVPWECQHWHLNRLMTLIKICNIKNSPPKKQNKQAMLSKQRELNKQRKMQSNSTG